MAILINQKFARCTLCGKNLPPRSDPIAVGNHRLCSERCVRLLHKLHPDEVPGGEGDTRLVGADERPAGERI